MQVYKYSKVNTNKITVCNTPNLKASELSLQCNRNWHLLSKSNPQLHDNNKEDLVDDKNIERHLLAAKPVTDDQLISYIYSNLMLITDVYAVN